ncbi:MAG: 30S ribosomal protein S8 [Candidatus Sericytochromatia bacterium]|uniref:Small ribosomal subunit protein uS8 n=1 Tax=Candidatus Tanganyikabacteria bacterium TaxID=2961651 RepID=A0A937X6H6_9BACT|nr:30S ribosomal protein S8 [Candidatus Tanganyikabacteria bacterium]
MPVTDPIADMLTHIRNANTAFQPATEMPASKVKVEIARVLLEEGYISKAEPVSDEQGHPRLKVTMKYIGEKRRSRVITGIKRISKPGLRVYAGKQELPRVLGGLGIAIVSTPKGIMTDRAARKAGVGGEVLAYVW